MAASRKKVEVQVPSSWSQDDAQRFIDTRIDQMIKRREYSRQRQAHLKKVKEFYDEHKDDFGDIDVDEELDEELD